jgi:hypothetical protein
MVGSWDLQAMHRIQPRRQLQPGRVIKAMVDKKETPLTEVHVAAATQSLLPQNPGWEKV